MADGIPTTLNGQGVLALSQLLRGFGTLQTFRPVPQVGSDGIGAPESVARPEAASAQPVARRTPPEGVLGASQAPEDPRAANPDLQLGRNLDLLA